MIMKRRANVDLPDAGSPITTTGWLFSFTTLAMTMLNASREASSPTLALSVLAWSRRLILVLVFSVLALFALVLSAPALSTLSFTHCSMMSRRSPDSASTTNEVERTQLAYLRKRVKDKHTIRHEKPMQGKRPQRT